MLNFWRENSNYLDFMETIKTRLERESSRLLKKFAFDRHNVELKMVVTKLSKLLRGDLCSSLTNFLTEVNSLFKTFTVKNLFNAHFLISIHILINTPISISAQISITAHFSIIKKNRTILINAHNSNKRPYYN